MSMDDAEVVIDYAQGLPTQSGDQDQEAYHFDPDTLAPNTDELDFGLDEAFNEPTNDAVDLSAVDVEHPLEEIGEIGYEEETEDAETTNDADPATSTSILRDEYDGDGGELDEIGYEEDDDFALDSTTEHPEESLDTGILESHAAQDAAGLAPKEVEDFSAQNPDALQEIEIQVPGLDEDAVAEDREIVIDGTGAVYDDEQLAQELGADGHELEVNDLESAESMEHDGTKENEDVEDDDDDDNEIGNSESHQPFDLPDVAVEYNHVRYSLFGGPEDHDDDYFLKDMSVLDKPLSHLFSCLRDVIVDDLSPSDELLIRIDNLNGLEFREHSTSSVLNRNLHEILDLYYRLLANDDLPEDRLLIHLVVAPDSEDVLARLLAAAEDGQGFSELAGSSGGVSPAIGHDDQRSYHEDVELHEEAEVGNLEYAEEYSVNEASGTGLEIEVTIEDEANHSEAAHDDMHPLDEYAAENYVDIDGDGDGADQFENFDVSAGDAHLNETLDGKTQYMEDQDSDTARDIQADHEETDGETGDIDFAAVDLSNPDATADTVRHEPLVDSFDAENESGAAAQDHSADGVEFSLDVGGGIDMMVNDPFEYALHPDDDHDGAHKANATADSGELEYQVDVGSPSYGIKGNPQSLAVDRPDGSFSKVTQDEATHHTADQGVSSAQTSATSTLNGEEITYDENDAFEQTGTTNPTILDLELGTTVDEIDWENAEIGADDEAKSINLTPKSTSGKRLRQVEDLESLVDEGDNKRRRT